MPPQGKSDDERVTIYGYPATVEVTLRDEHGGVLVVENPVSHVGGGHVELDLAKIAAQIAQAERGGFGRPAATPPAYYQGGYD